MEVHQQDTLVNDEDLLVAVCLGLPARYPRAPCRSHLVAAQRPASPARLVRAQDLALSPVVAFVWKAQTLGLAFLEGSALRYAQIADPAPEFIQLQSLKHTLKPETIVAPASCDHAWMTALGSSPLLQQCAAPASGEGDEDNVVAAAVAQPAGEGSTIVRTKSRDWNAEAAYKRMALLRGLEGLSGRNLSDIEVMLHLEHIVPRELEQARRAIGGLLAHMASDETGGLMRITSIEKHKLDAQLYIAPETFLSLNIFADDRHPSAHGGRAKEGAQACASECYSPAGQAAPHTRACVHTTHTTAPCATIPWGIRPYPGAGFSVWTVLNKTRSKPGERLLRGWFARPTQDPEVLKERHDALEYLLQPASTQLLPQLHEQVGKLKDVSRLEDSIGRGGPLLADYTAAMWTSTAAVKVKEILLNSETPTSLPFVRRALEAFPEVLYNVASFVANVVDFDSSKGSSRSGARTICVHSGVHPELDRLREEYAGIEPVLTHVARDEWERLGPSAGTFPLLYPARHAPSCTTSVDFGRRAHCRQAASRCCDTLTISSCSMSLSGASCSRCPRQRRTSSRPSSSRSCTDGTPSIRRAVAEVMGSTFCATRRG